MKKTSILIIILLLTAVVFQSCQEQVSYKVAHVNLQRVYKALPTLAKADTVHQQQLLRLDNYVKAVDQKLQKQKNLPQEALTALIKAYNDTITMYRQQVDQEYSNVIGSHNNKIQAAIDSLAKVGKYDYVLSTNNANILFVKDSTNNITFKVIGALK